MQIKQSTVSWLLILAAFIVILYLVGNILMPFVFGAIVAYFLDPSADRLEERGMSRTAATCVVLGAFLTVVVGVILLFGPLFFDQIGSLVGKIPEYVAGLEKLYGEQVKDAINSFVPDIQGQAKDVASQFSTEIIKISGALISGIFTSTAALFGLLSLLFISPVIAFYLLRDWDILVKKVDDLLPRARVSGMRRNFVKIDNIISAYIRGQVTVCLIMAAIYSILLALVGLNYSLAIGFLTGVLSFVPYVGMAIGATTGLVVAYFQFGFTDGMLMVLAVFILGNLTEGNIITPKLVGDSVQLHPAWIIFALLAGGSVFGFTGVLIAIPAAAVIGVLTRSSVEAYKESALYLGYGNAGLHLHTELHTDYQQEGVVTNREEMPVFESFSELKPQVRPEAEKPVEKPAAKNSSKKKPKKKKKEPELKFPKK